CGRHVRDQGRHRGACRQELLAAEQRMAALRAQQSDLSVQLIQALGGGYRPTGSVPEMPVAAAPSPSPSIHS
ncbi:hypothetical protein ACXWPU_09465, partial [Streptococcus pyogenes]